MTQNVKTNVNSGFDSSVTVPLMFEAETLSYIQQKHTIRLYPNVAATLRTNAGSFTTVGHNVLTVEREVISFSGSSTGSAKYPITGVRSIRTYGALFDKDGGAASASFSIEGYALKASREVYGAVEISYLSSYQLIEYRPDIELGDTLSPYVIVRLGSLLAFYRGNVATYELPLGPDQSTEPYFEVYRVVSKQIINEEGSWEKYPGWTGEDDSPTWPGGDPDPEDPWLEADRVHEIGYINASEFTKYETYHVKNEEPKVTDGSWVPEYEMTAATAGGGDFELAALLTSSTASDMKANAAQRFGL